MEMLITGMVIGVMIGVMFALIVKKDEYQGLSVPHTDDEFEAVCKDNLRLIKLNNELQAKLAVAEAKIRKNGEAMPWLDTSLPYEQEDK